VCGAEHSSLGDIIQVFEQSKAWIREQHAVCGEHSFDMVTAYSLWSRAQPSYDEESMQFVEQGTA
jgi:hypothetical protein